MANNTDRPKLVDVAYQYAGGTSTPNHIEVRLHVTPEALEKFLATCDTADVVVRLADVRARIASGG
ncbi:MAG: hypothetical protein M3619_04550 [Myxococcota bacterium]|nr:hypothetical protein [Myxococcota bacterium]